jgi:tryptophan halogenase
MIYDIKIVGGGSAGWMAAATLKKLFPNRSITIIESPNVPTVGVGESTIGQINQWLNLLGIEDKDFMKACDATYKLSIRFDNFYKQNSGSFHYPFGEPDFNGNLNEGNDWYFKKFLNPETPNYDYADCMYSQMALVNQYKISDKKIEGLDGYDFKKNVAYHFDATKFGIWLRDNYCVPKGVVHLKNDVERVITNEDGIEKVYLDDGTILTADLWVDCTGFQSMLLGKALHEPFNDYSDILPNNKAWACKMTYRPSLALKTQMVPYTQCEAIENGWVWTIPLTSRIGTGYVYSDKHITDEQALNEFRAALARKTLVNLKTGKVEKAYHLSTIMDRTSNPELCKNITMRIGKHKRVWVKNVVAIGLSAGFIEPLESNGLYTVHEFLVGLSRALNRGMQISQWDKDVFNADCNQKFDTFAQFVSLHYALSHRDDTKYWRDVTTRKYSKEVEELKLSMIKGFSYASASKNINYKFYDVFGGLPCVATGMNYFPTDPIAIKHQTYNDVNDYKKDWEPYIKNLEVKRDKWNRIASECPDMYDYLINEIYDGVNPMIEEEEKYHKENNFVGGQRLVNWEDELNLPNVIAPKGDIEEIKKKYPKFKIKENDS